jgi:uncharacterized protein YcfL
MKQITILALFCITLTGCAAEVTSSTKSTVVIKAAIPDMGVEKALELAEAECGKKQMSARIRSVTSPITDRYIFDCI